MTDGGLEHLGETRQPRVDPDGLVEVTLPSGAAFPVHSQEVAYLSALATRYMADNHFSNIADLQDVDRMLIMELLCFRWSTWLSRGCDYDRRPIDADAIEKSLKNHSAEVRQVKAALDITKKARDKAKGEDSVPVYITNLLARAKEFAVYRETQLAKALELFNNLKALVTLHLNCDDQERDELHMQVEDVLEWIVSVAIPEFDAVDEYFRTHAQRFWVRSL